MIWPRLAQVVGAACLGVGLAQNSVAVTFTGCCAFVVGVLGVERRRRP